MKKNLVLSQPQVTIDHTFMVPTDAIPKICREFVYKSYFSDHNRQALQSISDSRLQHDVKLNLDKGELPHLKAALEDVRKEYRDQELAQIGGNPGIFALRGYYLGAGGPGSSLPIVRYVGLRPRTYDDFERDMSTKDPPFHKVLLEVFREDFCALIDEQPMSMSLEGKFKVIFAYRTGR